MESKAYWVGFNLVKGIGPVRLSALLSYFGDIKTAWQASFEELRLAGLPSKVVGNLIDVRHTTDLEQVWNNIQKRGVAVFTWEDDDYPARLREIDQPPPVLYVVGDILPQDEWAVSIVGTRRMTAYGRQVTNELAHFLVQNGITVVSGLARGVDGVAHQSALDANGRTLAVLGSGVDRVYPPEHRKLAEKISGSGAIISDYALGTPPEGINFPPRNRIIAGLSLASVIVEAGDRSGALITATFSVEQGREVLAVPGNINAPQSKGPNKLIAQGARPYLKPEDVLEAINLEYAVQKKKAQLFLPKTDVEELVLGLIGNEALHVDEICVQSDLSIEKVLATITMMELKGMVQQTGNMNYIAVREDGTGYEVV